MTKAILSLCDYTGIGVEPWVEAGYDAILVDPQHEPGVTVDGQVTRIGRCIDHPDTWRVIRERMRDIVFVASYPPCTQLAVSGARWFKHKAEEDPAFQFKAMQVVWQCHNIAEMIGAPYFIENPVSRISSFWRKPDHTFHPHDFTGYEAQDNYFKKTCIWSGGGFVMPDAHRSPFVGEPDDRIHKCAPGPDRANIRSATPRGFAIAVFEANAKRR